MIHKYDGQNFIDFRKNIFNYFEQNHNVINQNNVSKNLTEILKKILDISNLGLLSKLDNYDLKFHNWLSIHDAIDDSTLGKSNNLLYAFSESHRTQLIGEPINVIESLFLALYADIYEASLIANAPMIKSAFEQIINNLQDFSSSLSPESFFRLTQIWFIVPREVFTKHLDQHLDENVLKAVKDLKDHNGFMKQSLIESKSLKQDIKEIKKSLEDQKSEYNFVGLSNGFKDLKKQKLKELCIQNWIHYLLMFSVIALIVMKFFWSINYLENSSFDNSILIVTTISTILVVFIILYFFKISLVNIKSIKSQILQIDLRLTLCQFIHNYETDTAKLRSKDMKESFDKFESVIFAPLVATEEQMPATFDGLEQLTGLLSSFNKGSK